MALSLQTVKAAVLNNRGLKLLSLLLAVASWYAVRDATSKTREIKDVPLTVIVPEGTAVLSQSAGDVDVVFRGSQEDIDRLDRSQIRVEAIADGQTEGAVVIPVTASSIVGGRGVTPVSIVPRAVQVSLDHEEEKLVPVKARFEGKPLTGQVAELRCEPAVVRLRGPAQKLKLIEAVQTQPVPVEGQIETFQKRMAVLSPGETWAARIEPPEVLVTVTIVENTDLRTWQAVAVQVLARPGALGGIEVEPAAVDVTVRGPADVLAALGRESIRAFVDCESAPGPGEHVLPVVVHLPTEAGAEVETKPAAVTVRIRQEENRR